jgi:hypothetical protein
METHGTKAAECVTLVMLPVQPRRVETKIHGPLRVGFLRTPLTSWWLLRREKGERGWSAIE